MVVEAEERWWLMVWVAAAVVDWITFNHEAYLDSTAGCEILQIQDRQRIGRLLISNVTI